MQPLRRWWDTSCVSFVTTHKDELPAYDTKTRWEGTQFWRNPHGYRLRYASRDARLVREPSDAPDDASVQVGRIQAVGN